MYVSSICNYTIAAANVQASDAALAATPTWLKYIRPLQLYSCNLNAVAAKVHVSNAALANVYMAFATTL